MNINSEYFRAQQKMYSTKIKQEVCYLGPHDEVLDVGYEKYML